MDIEKGMKKLGIQMRKTRDLIESVWKKAKVYFN